MPDIEMSIPVYEQEVTVTVPITATSEIMRLGHGLDRESVEITITCRYQACDDVACGLPATIETKLVLPLQTLVEPDGVKKYVERLE